MPRRCGSSCRSGASAIATTGSNAGSKHYDPATVFAALDPANAYFARYRPQRHSLMADWSLDEFSRLRLQFARDKSMQGVTDNQVTLQYIMSLGAHGAHKF